MEETGPCEKTGRYSFDRKATTTHCITISMHHRLKMVLSQVPLLPWLRWSNHSGRCSHSHTMIPHWKPTVASVTLSITNRKSSHTYPNRHTTNILCCSHTQSASQAPAKLLSSTVILDTGLATHPSLRCHQPLVHDSYTYTATIPQANSKLASVLSHTSGSQQGVAPQLNMLLIYINFIICLSAS